VGLGPHTITVTATDAAGNSASCTTTFTVRDSTAPVMTCSAVPNASVEGNCQVALPNVLSGVTVSDGCTPANAITVSQSPVAGTLVGLGPHTITVTATDETGNSAFCTTTFTVTDTTAPIVTCSAVPNASVEGNCQVAVPNVLAGVTVSDGCTPASAITTSQSPDAGTLVGLGPHTITVTATDEAGNSGTCTTIFTVEPGTMVASGPSDLTRYTGQSASFSVSASGSGPFSYQWRRDGLDIAAATNATYSIVPVSTGDAGAYCVLVRGSCNSVTNCATLTVNECLPLNSGTPQLSLQTGLFEQKVRISNPTDSAFAAVRVLIRGLAEGVQIYNSSGDLNGVPFIQYNQALIAGGAADLTIEYYVPSRQSPDSQLCAQPVPSSSATQRNGAAVAIERVACLADGTILIEFPVVPGQAYYIQYCEDLLDWRTVTPGIRSDANRIQWIDNGAPKTESFPAGRLCRFYRVITSPE